MSTPLTKFHEQLREAHLGPLWASIQDLNTRQPVSKPVPYLWSGELLQHAIDEATEKLHVGPEAERRAVFLINPGMEDLQPFGWGAATQTLYMAVQAVSPGEVAISHRHTNTALRFIMRGHGASGRVNGEDVPFEPGDFIVTPTWMWHDHANYGSETVFWIDCLDVPFTKYLGVCFTEFHTERQQPVTVPKDFSNTRYQGGMVRPIADRQPKPVALARYTWDQTDRALRSMARWDPDPFDGYSIEYVNPSTGGDAAGRIGARYTRLPAHYQGSSHRHVHSTVYHVYRGQGFSIIEGIRFDWRSGDFFVVPSWSWHEHHNLQNEPADLFSCNDLPIMEAFDFERVEILPDNHGHQDIRQVFRDQHPTLGTSHV